MTGTDGFNILSRPMVFWMFCGYRFNLVQIRTTTIVVRPWLLDSFPDHRKPSDWNDLPYRKIAKSSWMKPLQVSLFYPHASGAWVFAI
jgi:hypothetical protein